MTKAAAARKTEYVVLGDVTAAGTHQPLQVVNTPGIESLLYTATPFGGTMVLSQLFSVNDVVQLLPEGKIIFEQGYEAAEESFLSELVSFTPDLEAVSRIELPRDLDVTDLLEP